MGSVERRERERQETRGAILDAARSILGERGYDGLTMRAVADRIEYTPAALYKHFTDREQLVRELCVNDFFGFNKIVRERGGSTKLDSKAPHGVLRALGHAYAEFAMRFPEQYRVMFMTPLPVDQTELASGDPEQDAYITTLRAVEDAQRLSAFPGLDAALVAQTLWASIHGVVSIEIAHLCVKNGKIPFASLAARITTAIDGILLGLEALAAAQQSSRAARRKRIPPHRRSSP